MPDDDTMLPCPFCGGPAGYDTGLAGLIWVRCVQCGTRGPCALRHPHSLEELRNLWNRRTDPSAPGAPRV